MQTSANSAYFYVFLYFLVQPFNHLDLPTCGHSQNYDVRMCAFSRHLALSAAGEVWSTP